jgi:hypothetical protein
VRQNWSLLQELWTGLLSILRALLHSLRHALAMLQQLGKVGSEGKSGMPAPAQAVLVARLPPHWGLHEQQ